MAVPAIQATGKMPAMLMGSFTTIRSEKRWSHFACATSGCGSAHPMAWHRTGPGEASTTRCSTSSTRPPRNPEKSPNRTPRANPTIAASIAAVKEPNTAAISGERNMA